MPYGDNPNGYKKSLPSECDMSGYDLTKSSERYRWKQDQIRKMMEQLRDELWKSSRRHTVTVDDKCVLDIDTLDMYDFYGAVYQLFGISLE